MKKINTNINKIFDKAKSMEPVLDKNEVRELIASKSAPIAYNNLINNGVKKNDDNSFCNIGYNCRTYFN